MAGRVDVVEVTELPCRPRLFAGRGQESVQLFGGKLISSRVLVAEQWVPALTSLSEDFGQRRVPIASVQAVEGGLLPAWLQFGPAWLRWKVRAEVVILQLRKGVGLSGFS